MSLLVFKLALVFVALAGVWFYLTRTRSRGFDRLITLALLGCLVAAVVYPPITSWLAKRLGIGRGVDLTFYVGFVFLLFLVGVQRVRLREYERSLSTVVRQLALLGAHSPKPEELLSESVAGFKSAERRDDNSGLAPDD